MMQAALILTILIGLNQVMSRVKDNRNHLHTAIRHILELPMRHNQVKPARVSRLLATSEWGGSVMDQIGCRRIISRRGTIKGCHFTLLIRQWPTLQIWEITLASHHSKSIREAI